MPVTRTAPPTLKKQYPHVEEIQDWRAQQSVRLLWDRLFDIEARLQGLDATVGGLVSAVNALEDAHRVSSHDAKEALALVQETYHEQRAAEEAEEAEPETPPAVLRRRRRRL